MSPSIILVSTRLREGVSDSACQVFDLFSRATWPETWLGRDGEPTREQWFDLWRVAAFVFGDVRGVVGATGCVLRLAHGQVFEGL